MFYYLCKLVICQFSCISSNKDSLVIREAVSKKFSRKFRLPSFLPLSKIDTFLLLDLIMRQSLNPLCVKRNQWRSFSDAPRGAVMGARLKSRIRIVLRAKRFSFLDCLWSEKTEKQQGKQEEEALVHTRVSRTHFLGLNASQARVTGCRKIPEFLIFL